MMWMTPLMASRSSVVMFAELDPSVTNSRPTMLLRTVSTVPCKVGSTAAEETKMSARSDDLYLPSEPKRAANALSLSGSYLRPKLTAASERRTWGHLPYTTWHLRTRRHSEITDSDEFTLICCNSTAAFLGAKMVSGAGAACTQQNITLEMNPNVLHRAYLRGL